MDDKSLEMLEFHRVREIVAGYTAFPASRNLALAMDCSSNPDEVRHRLEQSAQARRLLETIPDFSLGDVPDTRQYLEQAARGRTLEPATLLDIAAGLGAARRARRHLAPMAEELPLVWEVAAGLVPLRPLEEEITRSISPDGEVLDSASATLASTRRELKETRQHLLQRLEAIIRSPRGQRIVQEPIVTERSGRYVIPIRTDARHDIRGIVHDVSNTGATLFIEPWSTVDTGNRLRELTVQEQQEVERVLAALSARVGQYHHEIAANIARLAELDLLLAKAKYARHNRATEANLVTGRQVVRLVEARHPLLGERAVPLSVELGRDFRVLVITGPNTGGKTVALKTVGLLALMTQAGLPIPASPGSCLPVFDGIFVDIGDEQSIEQTLSTFSWHIGNITRITGRATECSLVLLDELGTSTDPAQGSALARAILLHFLALGSLVVATTHLGDLKVFAHATPGLENASLDFDPRTMAPTYHLTVGVPGGSNTLATASRLGLPASIIEAARGMVSPGADQLETLLADLQEERAAAEEQRRHLESAIRAAEQQRAELEQRQRELAAREKTIIQETRDRVVSEAAALQREIRQAAARLRRERSPEALEKGRRVLTSTGEQLRSRAWRPGPPAGETAASEIAPGDTVWLPEAGIYASVVSVSADSDQIEVQAGPGRIRLSREGVTRVSGPAAPATPPPATTPASRRVPRELMLIGKRADEAELALETYLDDAALAGLSEVRIVHGSGTGTLRNVIRQRLASHPLVRSFRPGEAREGGNGVTIATL